MSRNLKKIGSAGRFGARYGIRARKRVAGIETTQRMRHRCPQCNHVAVKRVASGIWQCRHCDLKFAGGAYRPMTETRRRASFATVAEEPVEEEPVKEEPVVEEPVKEENENVLNVEE